MSKIFTNEIEKLKRRLDRLAGLVQSTVINSIKAFETQNTEYMEEVFPHERKVNRLEVEFVEECFKIIALHQPVSSDLRFLVAAIEYNKDLERMSDQATNIANIGIALSKLPEIEAPFDYPEMAAKTRRVMKLGLQSLMDLDKRAAVDVIKLERSIDTLHEQNYDAIKDRIREDNSEIDQHIYYLSVSRCLERIADLSTNIAEEVLYITDGEIIRHKNVIQFEK